MTSMIPVLENCETYDSAKLKLLLQNNTEIKAKPSALFCNIDGNASNFDSFVTDISQYCHEFSFIRIAETNIDPCHKDLYSMSSFKAEYNNKFPKKRKGTGVALYVRRPVSDNLYSNTSKGFNERFLH